MCPIHGEVSADEIAMGHEKSPGNYVQIDPEELDAVKTEQAKTITIDVFVGSGAQSTRFTMTGECIISYLPKK